MKGASVKVAILSSLFSPVGPNFHHEKNQPRLRRPSTFSEHWPWFWQYLLSKKNHEQKLVQNLGHNNPDKCIENFCVFFSMRNKCILMTTFLNFKNPIGPLALYCNAWCRMPLGFLWPGWRTPIEAINRGQSQVDFQKAFNGSKRLLSCVPLVGPSRWRTSIKDNRGQLHVDDTDW